MATVAELTASFNKWDTSYTGSIQQRDAARAAVVSKDENRNGLEEMIRTIARQIQADPNVTDAEKAAAGLPVHSTARTPVAVPTTAPSAVIDRTQVQEHTIRLFDDANPHRRSRPKGVMLCEIIGFVGNVHPTEDQFRPFGLATRLTKVVSFSASDSGKTAWYRFRWVNRRGEEGPWSETFTAPIL